MSERPILFSTPMVPPILDGRKTQTRRVVKLRGNDGLQVDHAPWRFLDLDSERRNGEEYLWQHRTDIKRIITERCPYGKPGDRLWVKEAFTFVNAQREHNELCIGYDADGPHLPNRPSIFVTPEQFADFMGDERKKVDPFERRKYPPMFMNRFFSRITLEITDVRVQRLQEISVEEAIAEGIEPVVQMGAYRTFVNYAKGMPAHLLPRDSFHSLWDSINGPGSWDANPWVWAVTFQRVVKMGKEK